MKFTKILLAATLLLAVNSATERAEARSYVSFGYYGPGIGIHVGHYPYYGYYSPYYYRPYYYRPYYSYRRYYSRPYTYRRSYSSRCSRWSRRCAANWGYGGRNYRGCMKYHRCR